MGVEGVDLEGGGGGGESEDGKAIEGGELREPPDGVDIMGLWESMDLWTLWEGTARNCHWFRVLAGVCVLSAGWCCQIEVFEL